MLIILLFKVKMTMIFIFATVLMINHGSQCGAIYTQGINSKDFSDPVTVIYGHNGYKETMFTSLHKFEDAEFFDSHEYFFNIYLPQRKLTYQVVSAFKY